MIQYSVGRGGVATKTRGIRLRSLFFIVASEATNRPTTPALKKYISLHSPMVFFVIHVSSYLARLVVQWERIKMTKTESKKAKGKKDNSKFKNIYIYMSK